MTIECVVIFYDKVDKYIHLAKIDEGKEIRPFRIYLDNPPDKLFDTLRFNQPVTITLEPHEEK